MEKSQYRVPLDEEIRSSTAIATGRVVAEQKLRTDLGDPEFAEATIYSFRVEKLLKGRLPRIIKLRIDNDSGRYDMDVGEAHILFLRPREKVSGADYRPDSCGSSSPLPRGDAVVKYVEGQIKNVR